MNFCEAMKAVCAGDIARRNGWAYWLSGDVVFMGPTENDQHSEKATFEKADMMATDWEVLN